MRESLMKKLKKLMAILNLANFEKRKKMFFFKYIYYIIHHIKKKNCLEKIKKY